MKKPADKPRIPTRERLIQAAIKLVADHGMAAATTAAIAQTAGVAEGTLYRHFESKDDLLIAAFRQKKHETYLRAAKMAAIDATPPIRLKETWKGIYRAYRERQQSFLFGQRFMESALAVREGGEGVREVKEMVGALLDEGVVSGDFHAFNPELMINLFLAPISYLLKAEMRGRQWSDEELDMAADAVLAGWRK